MTVGVARGRSRDEGIEGQHQKLDGSRQAAVTGAPGLHALRGTRPGSRIRWPRCGNYSSHGSARGLSMADGGRGCMRFEGGGSAPRFVPCARSASAAMPTAAPAIGRQRQQPVVVGRAPLHRQSSRRPLTARELGPRGPRAQSLRSPHRATSSIQIGAALGDLPIAQRDLHRPDWYVDNA